MAINANQQSAQTGYTSDVSAWAAVGAVMTGSAGASGIYEQAVSGERFLRDAAVASDELTFDLAWQTVIKSAVQAQELNAPVVSL